MSGEELLEEAKKTLNNLLVDDTIYTVLYVEYDAETGRYGCDHITIIYTGIKLNNKGE